MKRRVNLLRDGRNQVVLIPRDLELPGAHAMIAKDGDRLVIEPIAKPSLFDVIDGLPPLDEADSLDPPEDLPLDPVDL